MTKIAVIGAGLAGLTLAHRLSDKATVTVFEKSRGVGGRMSTRIAEPFQFDHGAQYFTARSDAFRDFLARFAEAGHIEEWSPRLWQSETKSNETWFVAAPKMTRLCKAIGTGIDIRLQVQVNQLAKDDQGWWLQDVSDTRLGPFDWVVSGAPAPQAQTLMPTLFMGLPRPPVMTGCFSLMLGFDQPLDLDWDFAKVHEGPLDVISADHTKPGRPKNTSLLVQSTNDWAEKHLEDDKPAVEAILLAGLHDLTGIDGALAAHRALHRWRYAATPQEAGMPFIIDGKNRVAACGDWCLGARVEAAFTSGRALADHLIAKHL